MIFLENHRWDMYCICSQMVHWWCWFLRLPSLSRFPGETLAPEDIEMDSMTFSMEDVSSEDLKVSSTFVSSYIDLQVISCHIGLKDVYTEDVYTCVCICFLRIGFIWKTSTLTSIFWTNIDEFLSESGSFRSEPNSFNRNCGPVTFFFCEKGQFESALADGWWCWCWILVVRKFQFYPFFHNHGSGKLPQMKGNSDRRDPIFHFHDGGKDNLCLLSCAIYCQTWQPLDRMVCLAGCHHWRNFTTSSSTA